MLAKIERTLKGNKEVNALIRGICRVEIKEVYDDGDYMSADIVRIVENEVKNDRVDALQCIKQGRKVIIVLNLCCRLTTRQSKYIIYEVIRESNPVVFFVRNVVGVEVSSSSSKLR